MIPIIRLIRSGDGADGEFSAASALRPMWLTMRLISLDNPDVEYAGWSDVGGEEVDGDRWSNVNRVCL